MVRVQTQGVSPAEVKALKEAVKENLGLSIGSTRKRALYLAMVIVVLGGVALLVFLLLSTTKKPPKAPPYNPPPAPATSGPGAIQWGAIDPNMPSGCQNEPNPLGENFTFGAVEVGAPQMQPPYSEQTSAPGASGGGCGGSIGLNPGSLGNPTANPLICPSGKLVTEIANAKWGFTNFLPAPASVKVIASQSHPQDHGWCYWASQYITEDYTKQYPLPNSGNSYNNVTLPPALQPNQGPAVLPPNAQVKVSLSSDLGIGTSTVGFMCSQFGVVKLEAREAYPPCQWESIICALLSAYADLPWWAMPLMSMGMEAMAAEDLEEFLATKFIAAGKCMVKSTAQQAAEHYAECEAGQVIARNAKTGAYQCVKSMKPGWTQVEKTGVACLSSSGSKKQKTEKEMTKEAAALEKKYIAAEKEAIAAQKAYNEAKAADESEQKIAAARSKWQKAENAAKEADAASKAGPSPTYAQSGGMKSQFKFASQSLSQAAAGYLASKITNCDKSLKDFAKCTAVIGVIIGDPCFMWSLGKKDSHCPTYWKENQDIGYGHRKLDNAAMNTKKTYFIDNPDSIDAVAIFSMPLDALDNAYPLMAPPQPLMHGSSWLQTKAAITQTWTLPPCKAPVLGVDTPSTMLNCTLVNKLKVPIFMQVQVLADDAKTLLKSSNNFVPLAPGLDTNWDLSSQIGIADVTAKSGVKTYSQTNGHWRFFIGGASFLSGVPDYVTTDFYHTWVSPPVSGFIMSDKKMVHITVTSRWLQGTQMWQITVTPYIPPKSS
jgi:hypothetical protein